MIRPYQTFYDKINYTHHLLGVVRHNRLSYFIKQPHYCMLSMKYDNLIFFASAMRGIRNVTRLPML